MKKSLKVWPYFDACLRAFARCWFLLAAGGAAALMFTAVPQGRVALLASAENVESIYALMVASLLITIQSTFFALVILSPRFDRAHSRDWQSFAGYFIPALVGMLPTVSLAILTEIQLASNHRPTTDSIWLRHSIKASVFLSFAFVLFIRNVALTASVSRSWKRYQSPVCGLIYSLLAGVLAYFFKNPLIYSSIIISGLLIGDLMGHRAANIAGPRRGLRDSAILMIVIAVSCGLLVVIFPNTIPPILGPATTIYILLNAWVSVGLLFYLVSRRLPRNIAQYLAVAIFICLVVRFIRSPFNEQTIRTLAPGHHSRPSADQQAERWLLRRENEIRSVPQEPYPVIFISAQGGGIRAAYWTAATLAALEDAEPYFSNHVFAISGASGGSLGSAVYTGIVKAKQNEKLPTCVSSNLDIEARGKGECLVSEVLSRDFLSPVLTSFLVSEVLSSVLRSELPIDRAAALESGFEQAWTEVFRGNPTYESLFQDSFDQIWLGGNSAVDIPSLLLNGTDADSGIGMVFSNLDLSNLPDVTDMRTLLGDNRFRLSTAVMMSARFPLISPVGRFDHFPNRIAVVDGGFADNFGSATLGAVIKVFLAKAEKMGLKVQPIVLAITNEPKIEAPIMGKPPRYTLLQPLGTLDRIRQIHTAHLRDNLKIWARENSVPYLDGFQLIQEDGRDFPLGWMLCDSVRNTMTNQILTALKNRKNDHLRVLNWLESYRKKIPAPIRLSPSRPLWSFEPVTTSDRLLSTEGPNGNSSGY